ncbi:hypothetical protein BpHYR1_002002 [Brachionus plicatilis]|uniref:Uncharacterized protein n=1 Tax=Brachionus plicatilis TaxID=10195 RepID=A0A3M7SPF8_BRAPC|nr:hypothetical protein BpHYR1_002002 [Brachionus plicatilis]
MNISLIRILININFIKLILKQFIINFGKMLKKLCNKFKRVSNRLRRSLEVINQKRVEKGRASRQSGDWIMGDVLI